MKEYFAAEVPEILPIGWTEDSYVLSDMKVSGISAHAALSSTTRIMQPEEQRDISVACKNRFVLRRPARSFRGSLTLGTPGGSAVPHLTMHRLFFGFIGAKVQGNSKPHPYTPAKPYASRCGM